MTKGMTPVFPGLYQFTDVLEPIKLSMHQYVLPADEPVLVQTGAVPQAQAAVPEIKKLLGSKPLKYILISHFESDECGGIAYVLKEYPEAIAVCSETTARQLWSFGLAQKVEIKKPGEHVIGRDYDFTAIAYPSEMHLWEGLLFFETKQRIFFSSDLLFRMGETHGQIIESAWADAVKMSGIDQFPSPDMRKKMTDALQSIAPVFAASGHGPCLKITG